jgi:hypothetical protein
MAMSARWRPRLARIAVGGFLFLLVASGTVADLVEQNWCSDFNYYGCDAHNPDKIGAKINLGSTVPTRAGVALPWSRD